MPGFDGVETLKKIREINHGAYQDLCLWPFRFLIDGPLVVLDAAFGQHLPQDPLQNSAFNRLGDKFQHFL